MAVKIWHSYSCNNSSSFRIVARFESAAKASEVAAELRTFLAEHSAEVDAREEGGFDDPPSAKQRELGEKYGFSWGSLLYWGSATLSDDMPDVIVEDEVLIVLHTYCCGGFDNLMSYLEARGAKADEVDAGEVQVSVLFRAAPGENEKLDAELAEISRQLEDDGEEVDPMKGPWVEHKSYGTAAFFRDAGTVGLSFPCDPRDLANVKAWLRDHQIDKPVIEIENPDDRATFATVARARCKSCDGPVEYLDPRLHDIETPQLVCRPCGGLYELSAFTTA